MTKMTITQVSDEPRIWEGGQYGPLAFIKVTFEDGSQGDVACKPDNAENVIGILNGLKGKESDFQLEAKADYQGIKQWKIKDYPGKPGQQSGGGSGGGFKGGGQRHDPQTNASIEAQVAAKIAGEMALGMLANKTLADNDPVAFIAEATPKIAAAIRLAANGSQESGPAQSSQGGPLPTTPGPDNPPKPGGDEPEGEAPASPDGQDEVPTADGPDLGWGTGPMTAKQKAILNRLYGNTVTKAAHAMFPEVTKVGDINETMAAALIEDKE